VDRLPDLVVFADDWGRHPSSCQHLIQQLRSSYRILWINTIGTRRIRANGITIRRGWEKLRRWTQGCRKIDERFWVVDLPMLPLASSGWATHINLRLAGHLMLRTLDSLGMTRPTVITTLPHVWPLLTTIPRQHLVYYCTDDYAHWPDADWRQIRRLEQSVAAESDLILTVSRALQERFSNHADCHYFPHGVDYEHFSSVTRLAPHDEIGMLAGPRVGYFGLIYEKLDFSLLAAVAASISPGTLAMIGRVDFCPAEFRSLKNVCLCGPQLYADLPKWLAGLDVLLMPYLDDPMIRQSNPLKLRECLATGIPTVSVAIPEVACYRPHVTVSVDTDDFVRMVKHQLQHPNSAEQRAARSAAVTGESWRVRAAELHQALAALSAGRPAQAE